MHSPIAKLAGLVALVAALSIGPAGAQQSSGLTSYDVELVIFRTLSTKATPEDWSLEAGLANQHLAVPAEEGQGVETVAPPPPTAPTLTFPALSATKFKLTNVADALKRNRNYQPLAHFGWTQPGFPRGESKYMSLDGLVSAGSGLTGQIALARGRYLHLTLELALESPEDGGRLVLRQTRRMRSNERHYIDHPKFGVIAIITPSAN